MAYGLMTEEALPMQSIGGVIAITGSETIPLRHTKR